MRFIDAESVHRRLDYASLVEALAAAHRQAPPATARVRLMPPEGTGRPGEGVLVLPAWAYGRAIGVKMATILPGNAERGDGLPSVQAVYQLFDGATGTPLAAIDGTALTLWKTAADSALGSRLLARSDARTMLMVGAGALAPHLIAAHRTVRPSIARVLVWNRTPARASALAQRLRGEGVAAEVADGLDAAVAEADLISVATMSKQPLVRGALLKSGAHLDLVGGYTPEMREADDEAVRKARIFVNYRGSTVGEVGDLTQPMAAGVIREEAVEADLFDLCQGRHAGRESEAEITLYKNGGGGHLDLFTAEALLASEADADA